MAETCERCGRQKYTGALPILTAEYCTGVVVCLHYNAGRRDELLRAVDRHEATRANAADLGAKHAELFHRCERDYLRKRAADIPT